MTRRRGRSLRDDEALLWSRFAEGIAPRRKSEPSAAPAPFPQHFLPAPEPAPPAPPMPRAPELLVAARLATRAVTALGPATPGLDRNTARRLMRGRTEPQARIDLHGHTLDRAHGELSAFIARVHGQGLRCVLVITGKGRPAAGGWPTATLRESVPRWLGLAPLAGLVVGVYPAHAKHGGGGAFYVYLKRGR